MVLQVFNPNTPEAGRQISGEFKASLVCVVTVRTTERLSLKKPKPNKQNKQEKRW